MKKSLSILLIYVLIVGTLVLSGCGGNTSDGKSEVDTKYLSFTTVGELKKTDAEYEFIKADSKLADDLVVCQIKDDAEGDITVPATHDDKDVVAVISESAEGNTKFTSLTLENGVSFIENCFAESSYLEALTLPDSIKGVYHSFNHNDGLEKVIFPASVKYIVDSFNDGARFVQIATNGFVYGISDSFNDGMVSGATFNGSIQKIENSFNSCAVETVVFTENIHDVVESFNECAVLNSVSVEQIANIFKYSFCRCMMLQSVKFAQGAESIMYSFNENETLASVDLGGEPPITDSFMDCPNYTLPETPAE